MGQYYSEDDWNVSDKGETMEDAIKNIINKIENYHADLWPSDTSFYNVEWIEYNGNKTILTQTEINKYIRVDGKTVSNPEYVKYHTSLFSGNDWKELQNRLKAKKVIEKAEKERKQKEEQTNKERNLFKKLKEKFEND